MSAEQDDAAVLRQLFGDDPPVNEDEAESAPPSHGTDPTSVAYVAPSSTEEDAVRFLAEMFGDLDA